MVTILIGICFSFLSSIRSFANMRREEKENEWMNEWNEVGKKLEFIWISHRIVQLDAQLAYIFILSIDVFEHGKSNKRLLEFLYY